MANHSQHYTSIPVSPETRDSIKRLKRGGESWDALLSRMGEQYDPDDYDH